MLSFTFVWEVVLNPDLPFFFPKDRCENLEVCSCVCESLITQLCQPDVFWCCDNKPLQGGRWGEGHNALNDESATCHLDRFILPVEMSVFTWQQGGNTYHKSLFGSGSFLLDHLVLFRTCCCCTWTILLLHSGCFEVTRWYVDAKQSINREVETSEVLRLQSQHNCDSWWNMTSSGPTLKLQVQIGKEPIQGRDASLCSVRMSKYVGVYVRHIFCIITAIFILTYKKRTTPSPQSVETHVM